MDQDFTLLRSCDFLRFIESAARMTPWKNSLKPERRFQHVCLQLAVAEGVSHDALRFLGYGNSRVCDAMVACFQVLALLGRSIQHTADTRQTTTSWITASSCEQTADRPLYGLKKFSTIIAIHLNIPQIAIGCPFWLGSQRDLAAQATIIISESRPLLGLGRFQRCFR